MKKRAILFRSRFLSEETGMALIIVLVLLVLGSLMMLPVLAHLNTALKTGQMYEEKSNTLYTADAGIEDALWRLKYDSLGAEYNEYDYETAWSFETDLLNGTTANLTIENVWIPTDITLNDLSLTVESAETMMESGKLVVTGSSGAIPGEPYNIKIDFTPATGDNLTVKSIGVWLPQGFEFISANNTLEANPSADYYPDSTSNITCPGGSATVWSYTTPYPLFVSFPEVDPEEPTMTTEINFCYTPPPDDPNLLPTAIAWITTEMTDSLGNPVANPYAPENVPISWDMDTRIFHITSESGDTSIDAYSSKCELRQMGDAMAGDYVAVGNSLMDTPSDHIYTYLHSSSSSNVTTIPEDADAISAYLYWSGFRYDDTAMSDTCSSSNFSSSWQNGGDWSFYSSNHYYYRGQHSGDESYRYLTLNNGIDLSGHPAGTEYELAWKQSVTAPSDIFSDGCSDFDEWDNGAAWSIGGWHAWRYFQAKSTAAEDDPERILTISSNQDLSSCSYVTVSWDQRVDSSASSGDGLDFAVSSDNGSTWSDYTEVFRGNIGTSWTETSYSIPGDFGSEYLTNGFMIKFKVVGFTGSNYCQIDNIKISVAFSDSDGLDFALYDGSNWSSNIEAFRGNIGTSWVNFSYDIPEEYINSDFKIRFYLAGIESSGQYCNIDDIEIIVRAPDTAITFSIDGHQVYLDANGDAKEGTQDLTASSASILVNESWDGFSFACSRDVSKLIKAFPEDEGEEYHTGNANYTVGDVDADTGEHVSYAGWSLIIVYTSPETAGHYLYLFDVFSFNPQYTNLDFDFNGEPGGDITGFVIPEPIKDRYGTIIETTAARLTAFVGEGDEWLYGSKPNTDCVKITGQQTSGSMYLSNEDSPDYNVWNSDSYPIESLMGVDIDTFEISWDDGIFFPGDTQVHLDLYSGQDAWNIIYFILSVRSETVTGGTSQYIIYSG